MTRAPWAVRAGLVGLALVAGAPAAVAATSFSNSLTGFTGNSTQGATQAALATAGFTLSDAVGAGEDPPGTFIDPTITFDAQGATFGSQLFGDGGRNYLRTADADYANVSFTAEITIVTTDMENQDVYFGLGAGKANPLWFRLPDYETRASSVSYFGESENIGLTDPPPTLEVSRTRNGSYTSFFTDIPTLPFDGTHKLRIAFDRFARTFTLGFDVNYAGGAFAADVTTAPMPVADLYGVTGWQYEPSRIFFGGDDGMVIKDFSVNVTSPVARDGDFNSDGFITAADWIIMRTNQKANLSGDTLEQAFFKGDLNGDKKNDHADLAYFKQLYDYTNGVGSFMAMVASVPEPGLGVLLATGVLTAVAQRRRMRRSG